MAKVREMVLPKIERHGPIEAWIIDDTGFPKKGRHSVGVARQYCGQLGKQDNCQVAVSLSIANHQASLPVRYRLYLPKDWAEDADRRRKAGVPEEIGFKTKPEIALEQMRWACAAGLPRGVVLLDAGYGNDTKLRTEISALALIYVAGILSRRRCGRPAPGRCRPSDSQAAGGRRRARAAAQATSRSRSRNSPSACLEAWRTITWREGTAADCPRALRACACARPIAAQPGARVAADRVAEGRERADQILALDPCPRHCLARLVDIAKLRWRIERDYQELKQEVGLGHFEGRGWRGFHHHATLCIAAYGFLISERETIPPSAPRPAALLGQLALPAGYRPRGSADAA